MKEGPTRSCAGCRRRRPQAELIRIVRRRDGSASVDPASPEAPGRSPGRRRLPGRGAYVCVDAGCARRALRSGALRRALRLEEALPPELASEIGARIRAAGTSSKSEEGRYG